MLWDRPVEQTWRPLQFRSTEAWITLRCHSTVQAQEVKPAALVGQGLCVTQ